MITIPEYASAQHVSITFAMIIVGTAMARGFSFDAITVSADPHNDASQLNGIADWLIREYPDEFERAE